MMGQVSKFKEKGLITDFIGEAQSDPSVKDKVLRRGIKLVYVTPESLIFSAGYREMLMSPVYQTNLKGFVVDEAHCVKTGVISLELPFQK